MKRYRALMTSFLALVASTAATQLSAQTLDLWQTDVCEKVFPDTPVGDQTSIQIAPPTNTNPPRLDYAPTRPFPT